MGMKRISALILSISFLLVSLIGCAFRTATADISNVKLSQVWATVSSAYYLSNDGILYCPGVDSDGSSFVVYKERTKGVVAKEVKAFNEIIGGGYYIDFEGRLFLWNEKKLPLLGYHNAGKQIMIAENVVMARWSQYGLVYIDTDSNLYLVGNLGAEEFPIDKPKILGRNASAVDINESFVVWSDDDGNVNTYGNTPSSSFLDLASSVKDFGYSDIQDVVLSNNYIILLADNNLLFWGDYSSFISGEFDTNERNIRGYVLASNIRSVSSTPNTIAAIDQNGDVLLWGKCLTNGLENTRTPQYEYFEGVKIASDAISVSVSGNCLCYVSGSGVSHIYHAGGWPEFYGNSTRDICVGIMRSPNSWN